MTKSENRCQVFFSVFFGCQGSARVHLKHSYGAASPDTIAKVYVNHEPRFVQIRLLHIFASSQKACPLSRPGLFPPNHIFPHAPMTPRGGVMGVAPHMAVRRAPTGHTTRHKGTMRCEHCSNHQMRRTPSEPSANTPPLSTRCPRTPQGRGLRPARREVPATGVATGP